MEKCVINFTCKNPPLLVQENDEMGLPPCRLPSQPSSDIANRSTIYRLPRLRADEICAHLSDSTTSTNSSFSFPSANTGLSTPSFPRSRPPFPRSPFQHSNQTLFHDFPDIVTDPVHPDITTTPIIISILTRCRNNPIFDSVRAFLQIAQKILSEQVTHLMLRIMFAIFQQTWCP